MIEPMVTEESKDMVDEGTKEFEKAVYFFS